MKIAQILPSLNLGGVERGVIDEAIFLKEIGIDNIVISSGGRLVKELKVRDIPHYTVRVDRKDFRSLFKIKEVRKILIKENITIVHARSRVPAWISFFATRGTSIHFITTAHGLYSPHIFSAVMGWGKFIIAPSDTVARHIVNKLNVLPKKIRIIPRWVNLDEFKFVVFDKHKVTGKVFSLGRISPSKGYEYLINAFFKITRINPYLKLYIIGEAEPSKKKYVEYLKSLIHKYSLSYNVQFLGYRKDTNKVLEEADVLVVPSVIEESFGRVVVEAFAKGVPVVASKIGALGEIIQHERTGLLVPARDADALKDAILKLINNRNFAEKIVRNARLVVEQRYQMKQCLKEVVKVYNEAERKFNILVIKISSLGDIILAIPSFKEIKDRFPSSSLVVVIHRKYASLFRQCPYIDRIITVDDHYKKIREIFKFATLLRREAFDFIIDLQNNFPSHLLAFLAFPRISVGFNRKYGFLLHRKAAFKKDYVLSPLSSQEKVLSLLGIKFKEKRLIFWDVKTDRIIEKLPFLQRKNFIGINISASSKWKSKNWPEDNIKDFIKMFHRQYPSYNIILTGDSNAQKLAQLIPKAPYVFNLCGKTQLDELPQVLKFCRVFITPDTAVLHLAESMGIATIGLFGPTDPSKHTVPADNLYVICRKIECSFCYKPYCKDNRCMRIIKPAEVLKLVKNIL